MELTPDNLAEYLKSRAQVPVDAPVAVTELAGGVSNIVLLATWPEGGIVVKQSLRQLRVEVEWSFDRARIFIERDCLDVLDALLPGAAPRVIFADDDEFAFGMTVAPPGGEVWRDALHAGRIDEDATTSAAGLLGRLQQASAGDLSLAERFDNQMPLLQGRVDPFHRTVATLHPDLRPRIEAEVERLLSRREVLVHGDYSPKNLIAYPQRMMLLDCEVAHWGDPAFDPAFLMCHLLLDGCHHTDLLPAAAANTRGFWDAYRSHGGRADDEAAVVAELGCVLLARADGKSPLLGLDPSQRDDIRACGRELLQTEGLDVHGAVTLAASLLRPQQGPRPVPSRG